MLSAAVWLMLSSMLHSLRLSGPGGSFPKPLRAQEERHYLELAAKGDLEARNILIERNLRLVAHIMKNESSGGRIFPAESARRVPHRTLDVSQDGYFLLCCPSSPQYDPIWSPPARS